jgi:predicted ATPase
LRLFHYVCRQVHDRPVLIIATYRTEDAAQGQYLAQVLGSLRREHLAQELALTPLPETAPRQVTAHLFGGRPVAPAILDEITTHAEGNPFFATELAYALIEEGWADLIDGRWQ